MKTKSKISAYIFRGSAVSLVLLCAVVALSWAKNLPQPPLKFPAPQNNAASDVNGHKSAAPTIRSNHALSFAERIACQRAIEEIYWQHRIWPKTNASPKPPLDKVMSQAEIEKKVEDYLRKSQALEDYWQRPITPDQLQAEMERMASHTKQPEVLREIFASLGNDPFAIAECLARPVLAERLLTELYAHDQRFHGELKRRAKAELQSDRNVSQMTQMSGNYTEREWIKTDSAPADTKEAQSVKMNTSEWKEAVHELAKAFGVAKAQDPVTQIKTGVFSPLQEDDWDYYTVAVTKKSEDRLKLTTIGWQKEPLRSWLAKAEGQVPTTMAAVNANYTLPVIDTPSIICIDDTWAATSTTNAPDTRYNHTAVWTGSEMIVWGGFSGQFGTNTGGRYNPASDSWTPTSIINAPIGGLVVAVWTGAEMIVWWGRDFNSGRYNPGTDMWTAISTINAPGTGTAVWTGSLMIIWGGGDNTGGRYDPASDSWTPTSTTNAPAGRSAHAAVWTGTEMIVWGGYSSPNYLNTGGRYNPSTDSWAATSTTNAPTARFEHTAVWTGSEMIVWGGWVNMLLNSGGQYNPSTDTWTSTSINNAPDARSLHTAVWTGSQMIVWGGADLNSPLNTGGRYCPGARSPTPTPTPTSNVSVQMQRGASYDVFVNLQGGVDERLVPTTNSAVLVSQPLVSAGVVADGVTPLLFKFIQRTAGQASYTVTIDNPTLAAALHVWDNGYWSQGNTVTFDGVIPTAFAYIDGLPPEAVFSTGQTEINAVLTLTNTGPPNDVETQNFKVRRPPILLVHGYHSDGSTWTQAFTDQLLVATQSDFIDPISYGVLDNFNTWGSFAELVPELDIALSAEEVSFHNNWAFTRYDVVAHSQGGILARLLSGQYDTGLTLQFKGFDNFYRGRFRRVITIGSPHNGSTMAYYVSQLLGQPLVYSVMPDWLKKFDSLQPKFDPFGEQIHAINDASANVDPDAKFRAITDTINGGDVPPSFFPPAYSLIGLTLLSIQHPSQTRGEVVLSTGSDGIVDIQSQRGGAGTPLTEIQGANICHLRLCPPLVSCTLGDLTAFVFGTSRTDTSDPQVASTAATLLAGPSDNFGAFQRPVDLTVARKTEIDGEIPIVSILNLIVPLRPFVPRHSLPGATSYTFMFTPDPSEPLDGTANWYAEVFSPDGVTTAGLTVTPDPLDSTHVTVDVDASVLGDVALYLSYNSTTGHLIFANPVLVASIPPGANLIGIELHPNPITAMSGDAIGLEIWGLYDNGSTSQLFVQPDNSTFSSSNLNVAFVDSGTGQLTAAGVGDATLTATYAGLTNEATIHVIPQPRFLPTPRPHLTPRSRPTPPPHITPVPPPPSPRPTPVPRPTPPPHLTPVPSPTSPRPTPPPRP